jgi:hypothetical protein
MTKAALLGRPCIFSDRPGCMEKRARTWNLGPVVAEGNVAAIRDAIADLSRQRDEGRLHQGRRYEEFARQHSREALRVQLLATIDHLLSPGDE